MKVFSFFIFFSFLMNISFSQTTKVTVEFLYFEGCPNSEITLKNLKKALKSCKNCYLETIKIESNEDAKKHRFLGSPSIRVNGKDLEGGNDLDFAYSCRVYTIDGKTSGILSVDYIKSKILPQRE